MPECGVRILVFACCHRSIGYTCASWKNGGCGCVGVGVVLRARRGVKIFTSCSEEEQVKCEDRRLRMTPNEYSWMQQIVLGFVFLFLSIMSGVVCHYARIWRERRTEHRKRRAEAELKGIQITGSVPSPSKQSAAKNEHREANCELREANCEVREVNSDRREANCEVREANSDRREANCEVREANCDRREREIALLDLRLRRPHRSSTSES